MEELISIVLLSKDDITPQAVDDIDALLQIQYRSDRNKTDREGLIRDLKRSRIIVAWYGTRIVGMGILVRVHAIGHTFGSIHNLVVLPRFYPLETGGRIIDALIANVYDCEFVEIGFWLQDEGLRDVIRSRPGFKEKQRTIFRLNLRRRPQCETVHLP